MTSPKELYLHLWRTGFERGKLEIRYLTQRECDKMRLNLYRSVKLYRVDPLVSPDPDFTRILTQMELIVTRNPDHWLLTLRLKPLNPMLLEASRQLDQLQGE